MKWTWLLLFLTCCQTYVDVRAGAKGSVENPVLCDQPEGQRRYLNLLRGPDNERIEYDYLDSVPGPEGRILDRFQLENPARKTDTRGVFAKLLDYLISNPVVPVHFRIYMDFYHPGKIDLEPVPGYKLAESQEQK